MRIAGYAIASMVGFSLGVGALGANFFQSDKLTHDGLKTMGEGLGIEVKQIGTDPGKEKYTFSMKTAKLNIPVGAEISPSTSYIWLTVNLGDNSPSKKHEELLKQNGLVQPTFFYITASGRLMAAQPIDNRGITPVILRRCLDKIVADVDKTTSVWQN